MTINPNASVDTGDVEDMRNVPAPAWLADMSESEQTEEDDQEETAEPKPS